LKKSTGDNIVWGTACIGDNIVWGTMSGDNIVWGTMSGDNIVWGTSGDDNIVWGTSPRIGDEPGIELVPDDPEMTTTSGEGGLL
jgi:hypothetical protein